MGGTVTKTATVMTCVRNGYSSTPTGHAYGGPGSSPDYNNSEYMTFPDFALPAGSVIDSASMHWDMVDWDWQAAVTVSVAAANGAGTPSNQVGTKGTADTTAVAQATLEDTYNATNTARRMWADQTWWLKVYAPDGNNRKNMSATKAIMTINYTAPPDPPTLGTVARNSPTQATVNWTNNPASDQPYTSMEIWRCANGGAFSKLADITPTTTVQYVDSALTAGNSYRYYIKVINGAGNASSATSAYLYAVPTAPSGITAVRYNTTANDINWTDNPTTGAPYTTLTLERSSDGAAWTEVSAAIVGTNTRYIDSASATIGYFYRIKAVGPGGTSGTTATGTRTIVLPAAPTIGAASRVSDTQATVAWTDNPTSAAPYEAVYVERQTDGGTWTQIASLAGTAASYTDLTVTANHAYIYRVKSENTAGISAASSNSSTVTMTPAAPSGCTATKTGATAVTVGWTDNSNTESNFEVQRSVDGGAYSAIGTVGAGVVSYNDAAAPGGTLTYKVRAYTGALYSALSAASNSVTTTQPPAAPTVTNPWPAYSHTGATIRISWQHNTLDGSAQSGAQVDWTKDGVAQTAIVITGAGAYTDLNISGLGAGKVVTAKVKTKGLDVNYGPQSAQQSTTLAADPTANITTPATNGTVVTNAPLVVAWSYSDTFAQAGWTLQLLKNGVVAKTWTGTTETSKSLAVADLSDDSSFSLNLTVRSGSGFTATATRTFSTDYLGPTAPTISAAFDPASLSSSIVGTAGVLGGNPATDHLVLLRVDSYAGVTATETLADPLGSGSVLIDYVPGLDQTVTYRVLAVAANGAYSSAEAQVATVSNGAVAINFGDGFAQLLTLQWDAAIGRDREDDSETFTFAGRPDPVTYAGEHTRESLSVSAAILDDTNVAALEALGLWRRACTYRQPGGRRIHVKVERISDSLGGAPGAIDAALSLLKVE